jgi:hypothetical protein
MVDLANLENLDGARLVRVYTSQEGSERVYAWFGGSMVSIYDAELNEIDVFSIDRLPGDDWPKVVEAFIEIHEDEIFMSEEYTDDIFYPWGISSVKIQD